VNKNPIADPREWQTIRPIHPATNGSRVAVHLGGERLKIQVVFEKMI